MSVHACPANVLKQKEMLVLLAILACGCLTFWTQRTFFKGKVFTLFDSLAKTKIANKLVLKPKDFPKYWCGIASFVAGQGTAYLSNLMYARLSEPQVLKVLDMEADPLSLYLAIMVPDDIIGSLFRFGTWSLMFKFFGRITGTSGKSVVARDEPETCIKIYMTEEEIWIDGKVFLIHIAFWCAQVFLSVSFSFTVSANLFMLFGSFSPIGSLFKLFTNLQFSSCAMKLLLLAIPLRFGLEAVHATAGPPLIRYLSRTANDVEETFDGNGDSTNKETVYHIDDSTNNPSNLEWGGKHGSTSLH